MNENEFDLNAALKAAAARNPRGLRKLAVMFAANVRHLLDDGQSLAALDAAEKFLKGSLSRDELGDILAHAPSGACRAAAAACYYEAGLSQLGESVAEAAQAAQREAWGHAYHWEFEDALGRYADLPETFNEEGMDRRLAARDAEAAGEQARMEEGEWQEARMEEFIREEISFWQGLLGKESRSS